jgi:hypothetical protein
VRHFTGRVGSRRRSLVTTPDKISLIFFLDGKVPQILKSFCKTDKKQLFDTRLNLQRKPSAPPFIKKD